MEIPTNLSECIIELDIIFSDSPEDLEQFKNSDEKTAVTKMHDGLGRWIRNNWGLWTKDSKIYVVLSEMQIWHPDDMSSIILTSFHRYINNLEIRLKDQVEHYIEYWKDYEKKNGPIKK